MDILKDRLYILPPDSLERRSAQTVLYFILRTLTQLAAPFMSFTAEEIWQNFNFKEKSVFLSSLNATGKIDKKLEEKWGKILGLREAVQKALEGARQKGIIGSSLEAEVILYAKDSYLKSLRVSKEELATIFITSNVKIEGFSNTIQEIQEVIEGVHPVRDKTENFRDDVSMNIGTVSNGARIEIKKAEGEKCARCWKWSKEVDKVKEFPKLCPRCAKILSDKN